MTDHPAVVIARDSKEQIKSIEYSEQRAMASDWVATQDRLAAFYNAIGLEIEQAKAQGKPMSYSRLKKTEAYKEALKVSKLEVEDFNIRQQNEIEQRRSQYLQLGQLHAQETLNGYAGETGKLFEFYTPQVQEEFGKWAGKGNPLGDLFRSVWPESADKIEALLREALLKGFGPRETARLLQNNFFIPLNRSLNIARTEQLRAYRNASLYGYRQSGIVIGYRRLATHDDRVCAGCLFVEGEFIRSLDSFDEHPQGRCTTVPVLRGVPPADWQNNEAWFNTVSPEQQMLILGNGRYELWKAGKISLGDIPMKVHDPVWGNSWVPKPIYKLMKI